MLAVIAVVNGPGESKAPTSASACRTGEAPTRQCSSTAARETLRGTDDELAAEFQQLVDDSVAAKYRRLPIPLPDASRRAPLPRADPLRCHGVQKEAKLCRGSGRSRRI